MFGYYIPSPDEALLITGGKKTQGTAGRIVVGTGTWVMPFFRKVRRLNLGTRKVDLAERVQTTHGITVAVTAVVAFKVQSDMDSIAAAAERMVSKQDGSTIEELATEIFTGHLRNIVGTMTIEQIIRERETLATQTLHGSQAECSMFGLHVDSLQIKSIDDCGSNYIANMAKPQMAELDRLAKEAQAVADQKAQAVQQESLRQQAQQERDTQIAQAKYRAEVEAQTAETSQAGPLAEAEAQQKVVDMQRELAERNAQLREQQLVAEQIKPAEAQARALRINADAQASAAEAQAKQAEYEADAQAIRQTKAAEAQAKVTKMTAEADAEAANNRAAAVKTQGEAEAAATEAKLRAEAAGVEAKGLAEGAGLMAKAEAAAAQGNAQIKLRQIEVQPEIARAIAEGMNLSNAKNLTILNGAQGLEQLVGVGLTLAQQFIEKFSAGGPGVDLTTPPNGTVQQPAQHF